MSGNIRFLFDDAFDSATLALAVGSLVPGWELAAIQHPRRDREAKFAAGAEVEINIDLGDHYPLDSLGLVEFDLPPDTAVTLAVCSDDTYAVETFSHNWERIIGPIWGWLEGPWLTQGWLGYPSDADMALWPRLAAWLDLPEPVSGRYLRLKIHCDSGFYLGRVMLGEAWSPARNFKYRCRSQRADASRVTRYRGVKSTDIGRRYWIYNLTLHRLSDAEVNGRFLEMVEAVGIHRDFLVQLRRDDARLGQLTTAYARFASVPETTHEFFGYHSATVVMEESV